MRRSSLRFTLTAVCAVITGLALVPPPAFADGPPGSPALSGTTEDYNTVHTTSDGDLWAGCQSDDGQFYAANGDGRGFDLDHSFDGRTEDIVVNRIVGTPAVQGTLRGEVVAIGGDPYGDPHQSVGTIWSGSQFNRKPTGMLCVDGALYLAVQDLRRNFNGAPAATLLKSTDHGRTWSWQPDRAMFYDTFTTIFFADYGRDSVNAPDRAYLYAYGLDENWAGRNDMFLARIPRASIMAADTWQWWTGNGTWSAPGDRSTKQPVLHDDRPPGGRISQGGVVYNKGLGRYLYSTWIEHPQQVSFYVYEAANPWGPWSVAMAKDFVGKCLDHGTAQWTPTYHAGYATTMPAKFISSDGRTLWLQSNVLYLNDPNDPATCPAPRPDLNGYSLSLRRVWLTTPDNLVLDPGFEGQQRYSFLANPTPFGPIGPPWRTEGPDSHGVDAGLGLSRQGTQNTWIHPADRTSREWNAITQEVRVTPHTRYTVSGWVRTSASLTEGYFGVRHSDGQTVLRETRFGPAGAYTQLSVGFDSGDNDKVTLFAGYWAPGSDSWLRFDDARLGPT